MSIKLVEDTKLSAIGNAIRAKDGSSALIDIDDMPQAIANIPSGGGGEPQPLSVYLSDVSSDVARYTMSPVAIVNTDDELVPVDTPIAFDTADIYAVGVSSIYCMDTLCRAEVINAKNGASSSPISINLDNDDISSGSHGITDVTLQGHWIDTDNNVANCRYEIVLGGESNIVDIPGVIRGIALVSGTTYAVTYGGDSTVGTVNVTLTDGDDGSETGFKSFTLGIGAASGATPITKMQSASVQDDLVTGLAFKEYGALYVDADTRRYRNAQDTGQTALVTTSKISAVAGAVNSKRGEDVYMTLDEMPAKIAGISGGFDLSQCHGLSFTGGKISGAPDLSTLDTSRFTDMRYMFQACTGLTSLDLSNFDTSQVTDMFCFLSGCTGLTSIDLYSFDTSRVTNFDYLVQGCTALTSINLSSFTTASNASMRSMFSNCTSLYYIIWSQKTSVQPLAVTPSTAGITSSMYFFVPSNLLSAYKAANNWSTIQNQIYSISQLPSNIAALYEGHY